MTWIELTVLVTTTATLAAIPSSSVALVVVRSSTGGIPNGVAAAIGIAIGDLIFAFLALFGLAAIAEAAGAAFAIVRYVGGAYLIWLGIRMLRRRNSGPRVAPAATKIGLATSFALGIGLTMGDVKAIVFYAAFFPTIVDIPALDAADYVAVGFSTFLAVSGVKIAYAVLARRIAGRMARLPAASAIRLAGGTALASLGILLISKN